MAADNFLMRIQGLNHKNITMRQITPFDDPGVYSGGCDTTPELPGEQACFDFVRGLARTGEYNFESANYKLQLQVTQLGHVKLCVPIGEKHINGYDFCT